MTSKRTVTPSEKVAGHDVKPVAVDHPGFIPSAPSSPKKDKIATCDVSSSDVPPTHDFTPHAPKALPRIKSASSTNTAIKGRPLTTIETKASLASIEATTNSGSQKPRKVEPILSTSTSSRNVLANRDPNVVKPQNVEQGNVGATSVAPPRKKKKVSEPERRASRRATQRKSHKRKSKHGKARRKTKPKAKHHSSGSKSQLGRIEVLPSPGRGHARITTFSFDASDVGVLLPSPIKPFNLDARVIPLLGKRFAATGKPGVTKGERVRRLKFGDEVGKALRLEKEFVKGTPIFDESKRSLVEASSSFSSKFRGRDGESGCCAIL